MSAEVKTADDVLAFWFDGDIDVRARETPADVSPRASSPPLAIDSNPSLPFLVAALPEDASIVVFTRPESLRIGVHNANAVVWGPVCSPTSLRPTPPPSSLRPAAFLSPQDNHKHKWFPAGDKTGAIQRKIDDDIARTFGATVAAAESGALSRWRDDSPRAACALALLLDQFTRHVHRNAPDRDARVAAADAIAVYVAERCVERGWDAALTTPEQVFLLMPFRHGKSRTIPRLRVALARLDARIATHAQHASLLAKFRKTTLRCLQDMEGKQHADGDEILERSEFTPDAATDATMASHALYATVDALVRERAGLPRGDDRSRNPRWRRPPPKRTEGEDEEEDASSNASAEDEPSTSARRRQSPAWPAVGISLSGGVDSMALAVILKRLSRDASYGGFDVVAMHIDYDNRPESGVEADFVRGWCDRMGIECVVRKIAEVTRGVTPREQYEAESRAIRYGFYKDVAKTHAFPAVFVGHHEGDVQENIIANLMRGANLLAVNGMEETGVVEGVAIWRPMLPHSKAVVLDFAHKYGVPYFLDSTPTWSTRGKLRNQLVPLLADMFGEGFSRNLSLLGEDSAQLGAMVESACLKPFLDGMTLSDAGAYAECKTYVDQPLFFWKEAMKRMCHGLGSGMMKEKSVRELLDRFALKKRRRDCFPYDPVRDVNAVP